MYIPTPGVCRLFALFFISFIFFSVEEMRGKEPGFRKKEDRDRVDIEKVELV